MSRRKDYDAGSSCSPPKPNTKSRLSFWSRVGTQLDTDKQGQIDADWLTADWHEKEPPKKRCRRNVSP